MSQEDDLNLLYVNAEDRLGHMSPVEVTVKTDGDSSTPLRYTFEDGKWIIQIKRPDIRTGEGAVFGHFVHWTAADYPTRIAGARGLPKLVAAVREQRERLDAGAERTVREVRDAFARLDAERSAARVDEDQE